LTKIKICGLKRVEDIIAANKHMPDYIGFVFAKSRRQVAYGQAAELKSKLDLNIKAVGVFVDEPIVSVLKLAEQHVIDVIQLHGDENAEYIDILKNNTACPIIKAVAVQTAQDIIKAEKLPCDMLLLDAFSEQQKGGSGKSFDISLIPPLSKPYFLAGGLNLQNIQQKILQCRPYGVDISSGVETDGVKDEQKIKQLIEAVNNLSGKKEQYAGQIW